MVSGAPPCPRSARKDGRGRRCFPARSWSRPSRPRPALALLILPSQRDFEPPRLRVPGSQLQDPARGQRSFARSCPSKSCSALWGAAFDKSPSPHIPLSTNQVRVNVFPDLSFRPLSSAPSLHLWVYFLQFNFACKTGVWSNYAERLPLRLSI